MKENIMIRSRSFSGFIIALIMVSQISPSQAGDAVPVLLWGGPINCNLETSAVNPFLKTSREEFNSFLLNKFEGSQPVLVYAKDNLCVEDFTQQKEHLLEAVSDGSLCYLPAVETPLSVLMDLPPYNLTYDNDIDAISERQLVIKSIASLDSIPETYKTIKDSSPNLVAMLTGKSCSYRRSERVKRDTLASNDSTPFIVKTERVLFYSSEPILLKTSAEKDAIQLSNSSLIKSDDRGPGTPESPLTFRLQFNTSDKDNTKIVLEFKFEVMSSRYYTLRTVSYRPNDMSDVFLTTSSNINFPFNFSYHCSQEIIFQKDSVRLNITNMQVQIDSNVFSDAYNCVGFTTIPIWTGLFVTSVLALIMIWALTMIMDIRTMDRFDDPKGKTITISATE